MRFIRSHYRAPRRPLAERFWSHVDRRGPDECWLWLASGNDKGYGQINADNDKRVNAHRVAWELINGPIPKGKQVLHNCDVRYPVGDTTYRRCCNPAHFFLGTTQDNTKDMMSKGREARGERMGSAKLTGEQVCNIRDAFATGSITKHKLSRQYGISRTAIRKLISGETWSHIPLPSTKFTGRHVASKVTEAQVNLIRDAHAAGATCKELAAVYGITDHQISMIVKRKNWAHIP